MGLLALLLGAPAAAQVATSPGETPLAPPSEPSPETPPAIPPAAPPGPPASPFGPRPGVFPTVTPAPVKPAQPASPFGPAPGVFPGITPAPPAGGTPEAPAAPGAPPTVPTVAAPEQPITPAGTLPVTPPPLTPGYGFGTPLAPFPQIPAAAPLLPPAPPTTVGLPPLRPGALPVQANDLRAPPILITPTLSLTEAYTDNPRNTPNTFSDSTTHLTGGTSISFDSVRLQGQLSGSIDYQKYARATDLDSLSANLLGYGFGTVVRDHVFIDGRAAITQLSRTGGVGFVSSTLIPPSQQTQAEVISLSPIVRQSVGDWVDSELRANYAMNMFQNGSLLRNSTTTVPLSSTVPSTNLSGATTTSATLSVATGRRFTYFGSKLTLNASNVDSQSAAKSTSFQGYDDVEYQFNRGIAALGRLGWESIHYPLQPAASTDGPTWLMGGRLTPFPGSYLVLNYGRQGGFYGSNGAFRYEVTPRTTILASLASNLSSAQQGILENLNSSEVDAYGNVVNQVSGLPSALANPEFAYSLNAIYRQKQARLGISTHLDRDTYALFAYYDRRSAVGPPTGGTPLAQLLSGSDTALGANFTWSRSLTPSLSSGAALGYAQAHAAHSKTLTADLSLNYTLSATLSAVLHYQFINVDSAIVGSYRRNQVEIGVTRSF